MGRWHSKFRAFATFSGAFTVLLAAWSAIGAPAAPAADGKPYLETVPDSHVSFEMVFVPGGTYTMGSPAKEAGRNADEGPTHEVTIRPFWMGKTEVTWDEYTVYTAEGSKRLLAGGDIAGKGPDAISYPTPPYADETFGYGKTGQPAIAITQHAAMSYARWLSKKTGKTYRLPTEAEWEYACRAGTQTAYSFGASPKTLGDYAWFAGNAKKHPNPVGTRKPNAFGLFDLHGNVAEWVVDQYDRDAYAHAVSGELPVRLPGERRYPHVARGGAWNDKAKDLRCAARKASDREWSKQDPQIPQSIWWHTEATNVGFRLVRPSEEYPVLKNLKSKVTEESPY